MMTNSIAAAIIIIFKFIERPAPAAHNLKCPKLILFTRQSSKNYLNSFIAALLFSNIFSKFQALKISINT